MSYWTTTVIDRPTICRAGGSSSAVTTVDFAQITASLLGDGRDEAGSF